MELGLGAALVGADPPDVSSTTYAVAVLIAFIISCFQSLGVGLQKTVHLALAALPADAPRPLYYRQGRWLLGLASMTTASLLVVVNYSLLGQSRASAFAAITVVTNCVMAKYYLKEHFTRYDAGAAAFILAGVAVCATFGASAGAGDPVPLHGLIQTLTRPAVYGASAVAAATAVGLTLFVGYAERLGAARSRLVGSCECAARAFLGGVYSGSTGFFMKGVTAAVTTSFRDKSLADTLAYGYFYLFLLGLPVSLVMQLRALNAGLARFDAVELVPIYQASLVVVGVAWGWTFYEENQDLDSSKEGLFALGCVISVLGIAVLAMKPQRRGAEASPLLQKEEDAAQSEPTAAEEARLPLLSSGL